MENKEEKDRVEEVSAGAGAVTPMYGYPLKFGSRLDLMKKAVTIFATLESLKAGEVKIRKKLIDVLTFYALNGYDRETKKMITETMNISSDNLTQINAELTKSGYLIRDKNNFRKKTLHPDLERLKNTFITNSPLACQRAIIVRFDE